MGTQLLCENNLHNSIEEQIENEQQLFLQSYDERNLSILDSNQQDSVFILGFSSNNSFFFLSYV